MNDREIAIKNLRAEIAQWKRDDDEYMGRVGQHLGGSVARMAEIVEAILDGKDPR